MNHHDVTDAMKSIEHRNMEGWDKVDNTDDHYSESFVSICMYKLPLVKVVFKELCNFNHSSSTIDHMFIALISLCPNSAS